MKNDYARHFYMYFIEKEESKEKEAPLTAQWLFFTTHIVRCTLLSVLPNVNIIKSLNYKKSLLSQFSSIRLF